MKLQILYDPSLPDCYSHVTNPNITEEIYKILTHARTVLEKPTLTTKFQLVVLPFLQIQQTLSPTGSNMT